MSRIWPRFVLLAGLLALVLPSSVYSAAPRIKIQPNYGNLTAAQKYIARINVVKWQALMNARSRDFKNHVFNLEFETRDLGSSYMISPPGVEVLRTERERATLAETSNFVWDASGHPTGAKITINNNAAIDWHKGKLKPPAGKYDLLTAVMHEMIHALGFTVAYQRFNRNVQVNPDGTRIYNSGGKPTAALTKAADGTHTAPAKHGNDIMNPRLPKGRRRNPKAPSVRILFHDAWDKSKPAPAALLADHDLADHPGAPLRRGEGSEPDAPSIAFEAGCTFQDGFPQATFLDPTEPGRSDVWLNAGPSPIDQPYILGDSLVVAGPAPEDTIPSWESWLWFRVSRVGPGIDPGNFMNWGSRLVGDPTEEFVSVRMDSVEEHTPLSDMFCSYFHESDPGFDPAFPDLSDENEVLPDYLFTPGTKLEYFVTANYEGNPEFSIIPDTTDRNYLEFEVLPNMSEAVRGEIHWHCLLHVEASLFPEAVFLEDALELVIPDGWDRYDKQAVGWGYNGSSLYRSPGGNNGATLPQLLTYRIMLVHTGESGETALQEWDIIGIEDWLGTTICDASLWTQGLIMNGDRMAEILDTIRPSFLENQLGAGFDCAPYRDPECPSGHIGDNSSCVQVIDASGAYPPSMDYYVWGNYLPELFEYNVLFATSGLGNRRWFDYDGAGGAVEYSQIVNEDPGVGNFKSVIDGYSYDHITYLFDGEECISDSAGIVTAAGEEIALALEWIFGGNPPGFCGDPCEGMATDVPHLGRLEILVDRLYQNRPNPFNPRTVIEFSIARRSHVDLSVYDVSGRLVSKLVDERMEPGIHSAVWDGTDEQGHPAASGIYWSQLRVADFVSNKKILLLN